MYLEGRDNVHEENRRLNEVKRGIKQSWKEMLWIREDMEREIGHLEGLRLPQWTPEVPADSSDGTNECCPSHILHTGVSPGAGARQQAGFGCELPQCRQPSKRTEREASGSQGTVGSACQGPAAAREEQSQELVVLRGRPAGTAKKKQAGLAYASTAWLHFYGEGVQLLVETAGEPRDGYAPEN